MNYSISKLVNAKGLLTCPVCQKEFKPTDDTKYIAAGGYTCSWKCFLTVAKQHEEERASKKRKIANNEVLK